MPASTTVVGRVHGQQHDRNRVNTVTLVIESLMYMFLWSTRDEQAEQDPFYRCEKAVTIRPAHPG